MGSMLEVCSGLSVGSPQPMTVDFIGRGNIWISNTYTPSVLHLARYAIYSAIAQTAPGQLSVLGYDSDLSGVFAPFSSLSSGDAGLLEWIDGEKELKEHLVYLRQQIQAVQNVIQGRSDSLLSFRQATGRPIESYRLVVLSLDMGLLDQKLRADLSLLMRAGPACGISFLIISTTMMTVQTQGGRDIALSVEALAPNITVLEADGSRVRSSSGETALFTPLSAETILHRCAAFLRAARTAALPTVLFTELHDLQLCWDRSSVDGLTFAVGRYGISPVEITIGDEVNQRHNAIITGAVGQGKSNLISVIIHSLCQRYSPAELQLYLLDFKEGVTFKPFSNIGQDEYLPHARALGLESDVNFGLAVLNTLFSEYQRRMRLLKQENLKSIREYRRAFPQARMPRIVVIIDEFQMMFGDDLVQGQAIADMLEKSVRLFRAAGIHFILASQTLGGNMALAQKRDSIFSQVPIRIALKNSLSESHQTLGLQNSAAAFLRPREAIVNLDYGEVTQNRKSVIAFADEKLLKPQRRKWWEMARSETRPPYVFESDRRITLSRNTDSIRLLRREGRCAALVGERISVEEAPVLLPLPEEPGRNIAILGTPDRECSQALGIIQSIALSLALQHPRGDARFLFFDFSGSRMDRDSPVFAALMEQSGYYIECYPEDEFVSVLTELSGAEAAGEDVYVFGLSMDKWHCPADPFGDGTPLKAFVETGPARRMHFIGWWIKASAFTAQVSGCGTTDAFNSKIFLRMDERTVQSMTSPFVRWTAQNNRGLVWDSIEFSGEITFIPYAPVTAEDAANCKSVVW